MEKSRKARYKSEFFSFFEREQKCTNFYNLENAFSKFFENLRNR